MLQETRIIKESASGFTLVSLRDEMLQHREIECVGEIDDDSANSLIAQLRYLNRLDRDDEITMFINSPGGSVDSGMAIYDTMRVISNPIRTVCTGLAASMAALLFVSGNFREILPHGRVMIHDPLIQSTGGSALKLKAVSDDLMETRTIIAEIIAEHTGKEIEEILEKTASDCYFRAQRAVEFGLADRVIKEFGSPVKKPKKR